MKTELLDHPTGRQRRVVLYAAVPFALASILVYFIASRDVLLHPHGPAVFSGTLGEIGMKMAFGISLWLAPLAIPRIRPRTYLLLTAPIVSLLFAVNVMYALEYRELISIGAVEATMSTNSKESSEFLAERSGSVVWASLLSLLVLFTFGWAARRISKAGDVLTGRTRLVLASVTGLVLIAGVFARPRIFPVTSIKNTAEYFLYLETMDDLKLAQDAFRFNAKRVRSDDDPETYVIIVGETLRRRQMSHYGYGRPTTPRLDTTSNIVFLEDVISATATSQSAVKAALTPATSQTVYTSQAPSVIRVAHESGFATSWISNQDRVVDTEIALIADDADSTVFTNFDWAADGQYDEAVLQPLEDALSGPSSKKLIVVHLAGSHGEYWRRYPESFNRYTSTDCNDVPNGCVRGWSVDQLATINQYDNSVLYSDSVITEIIRRVQQQEGASAVMFFSDHGEELYDTPLNRIGHGFQKMTRHEVEIPAFIWLSPTFQKRRPQETRAVRDNRYRRAISEDFFHAIADLIDTTFPLHEESRSIFSAAYKEKPRLVSTPDRSLVAFACLKAPSQDCSQMSAENSLRTASLIAR